MSTANQIRARELPGPDQPSDISRHPGTIHAGTGYGDPRNPWTVYAASSTSGVFKSIDGGESWSAVNSGLTTLSVNSLAIDPQDSSTVYAATAGGGVFVISFAP